MTNGFDIDALLAKYGDDEDTTPEVPETNTAEQEVHREAVEQEEPDPAEQEIEEIINRQTEEVDKPHATTSGQTLEEVCVVNADDVVDVNLTDCGYLRLLKTGQWGNSKLDKVMSDQMAKVFGADKKMVSGRKKLVDSPTLVDINRVVSDARAYSYRYAAPWSDDGTRFVPSNKIVEYEKKMTGLQAEFYRLVSKLRGEYALLREDARVKLGGVFDPNVYPSVDRVVSKFYFQFEPVPMAAPGGGDWRVDAEDEAQRARAESYNRFFQQRIADMMNDRWQMVFDRVQGIIEFLDKKDAGQRTALHDSTIEQIKTMAAMIDTFNITRDPKITQLATMLRGAVDTMDPTQLKDADNQAARDRTRKGLQNVLDALPSLSQ